MLVVCVQGSEDEGNSGPERCPFGRLQLGNPSGATRPGQFVFSV